MGSGGKDEKMFFLSAKEIARLSRRLDGRIEVSLEFFWSSYTWAGGCVCYLHYYCVFLLLIAFGATFNGDVAQTCSVVAAVV